MFANLLLVVSLGTLSAQQAVIPEDASRPVVVTRNDKVWKLPGRAELPEGFELQVAAGPPLVRHPIMGCIDGRGRLFVGDAVGVNWNRDQLEGNPPNRILTLEDLDGDGVYDKSTVFADKMVFPQGALWLNGSLYVCSAPGLWKLTDKDGDGVADERVLLVGGFNHTGNAADVHGPWLHPNGRLYWCHGRKGHKVVDRDGTLVNEGLASGIWSCLPDGSDVSWHSLGAGDNPVRVDFTPNGDVIGVINLYGINPRRDTIMHWLYGGVYARPDQAKAIEGLPRTLENLPIIHDFGHVAVSGSTFWRRSGWSARDKRALQYMVTHFNTGRVMRMELTPDGSSWKAEENEFLKIDHPDVHPTDVLEDADGSLVVLDTGGWFRIGCPSSLMAKTDVLGGIYRVRRSGKKQETRLDPAFLQPYSSVASGSVDEFVRALGSESGFERRAACESLAKRGAVTPEIKGALVRLMAGTLDPALEHAVLHAGISTKMVTEEDVSGAKDDLLMRRLWHVLHQTQPGSDLHLKLATKHLDSPNAELAGLAARIAVQAEDGPDRVLPLLRGWLGNGKSVGVTRLSTLQQLLSSWLGNETAQQVIADMLEHQSREVRETSLRILSQSRLAALPEEWVPLLNQRLDQAAAGDLPLLLDAIKRLPGNRFDEAVRRVSSDDRHPESLRLRALSSIKGLKLDDATFSVLADVVGNVASTPAARLQAGQMVVAGQPGEERYPAIAGWLRTADPMLLKELIPLLARTKNDDGARLLASAMAENPLIASQQESVYRNALTGKEPAIFETILRPALSRSNAAVEAKRRRLGEFADKAAAEGNTEAGRRIFQSGKGSCIVCHKIADEGRNVGPDLSTIGSIRTERDLLESIIFPNNTLARDFETRIFETADGRSIMGLVKSHTAEGLLVADMGGNEFSLRHDQIVSDTTMTDSLMPTGLDQTLTERELIDLVAWLKSL
ncbi:MAG: c-type cytochrome [Akkermansiaceae bacterium]|nr:c-type cytochrome [Akkermansiaceae bacterium]